MSINTWIHEFYATNADDVVSKKQAVKHSLKKWKGALKKNLKRHSVSYQDHHIKNAGSDSLVGAFRFDGTTCALCSLYAFNDHSSIHCKKCPLGKLVGQSCGLDAGKEYDRAADDPKPMIKALRKTLKLLKKR